MNSFSYVVYNTNLEQDYLISLIEHYKFLREDLTVTLLTVTQLIELYIVQSTISHSIYNFLKQILAISFLAKVQNEQ